MLPAARIAFYRRLREERPILNASYYFRKRSAAAQRAFFRFRKLVALDDSSQATARDKACPRETVDPDTVAAVTSWATYDSVRGFRLATAGRKIDQSAG